MYNCLLVDNKNVKCIYIKYGYPYFDELGIIIYAIML